jgi:hypothetical protein
MHGVSNRAMHFFLAACATTVLAGTVLAGTVSAQSLLGPKPSAIQHVTVETGTIPETIIASKTGKVALHLDVTPKSNIHVYASGAKEFTAVSLTLAPRPGVTTGRPMYPAADPVLTGTLRPAAESAFDDAPAYRKTFRIVQPITLQPTKDDVVIHGVLNYQACDDRVCYPVASLPVSWTIQAR